MIKRFRARFDTASDAPAIGARVLVAPERLRDEWDLTTGGDRSYVPKPILTHRWRWGKALKIQPPFTTGEVDVFFEDLPPYVAPVAAVISTIGPRLLCDYADLVRLLDRVTLAPMVNDQQRAAAANAITPYLRGLSPNIAAAARQVPEYDTTFEYEAWLTGVRSVVGVALSVPPFPFPLDLPEPDPDPAPEVLRIRPDVIDRLRRNNREN